MGPADLQSYIVQSISDSTDLVDLLKIAEDKGRRNNGILKLAVDGECCLDRLYGGFYPDWVCGGQWDKFEQFLKNFTSVVQSSNLELVVFFNGSLEPERITTEWKKRQEESYKFLQEVHKHVTMKKKPPPKIWWIPPAFLRSAIRLAFRSLNMKVLCTLDDHHKDIVKYIKKNHLHGIVADNPIYLAFDFIERYFSAQKLKLTYKGSLETVEIKIAKVFETLNLPKDRFLIFAAIFGNHNLTEEDLKGFFSSLEDANVSQTKTSVIEKVAQLVRSLEFVDAPVIANLIVEQMSTNPDDEKQQLRAKVLKCLRYFGAVNNANKKNPKSNTVTGQSAKSNPKASPTVTSILTKSENVTSETNPTTSPHSKALSPIPIKTEIDDKPESETDLQNSLAMQLASLDLDETTEAALPSDRDFGLESNSNIFDADDHQMKLHVSFINEGSSSSTASSCVTTNGSGSPDRTESTQTVTSSASSNLTSTSKKGQTAVDKLIYHVNRKVENVAVTRHESGLMSPYICQVLKHKEIKLPLIIHDMRSQSELPKAKDLFRPLRQRVYAILFNLHHLRFVAKEKSEIAPPIVIKETWYDPSANETHTDNVEAVEVGWAIPTVEKLWLGDGDECKRKRIRAFFTCMKSEKDILLNSSVVPQHLLILCCVLRVILSEKKVLRKCDLDAFLLQSLLLELTDANAAQDIEISNLTMRGVHLSHLFMEGVEMALLVNDACGAPIPFVLFSPWFFFNGKVFNFVLEQQAIGKTLPEICAYKMDMAYNVEQLRMAVLDGLKPQFANQPPISLMNVGRNGSPYLPGQNERLRTSSQISSQGTFGGLSGLAFGGSFAGSGSRQNRGRGPALGHAGLAAYGGLPVPVPSANPFTGSYLCNGSFGPVPRQPQRGLPHLVSNDRQRRVPTRGGQLEIAGTVVGSWDANYGNPYYNNLGMNQAGAVRRNPGPSSQIASLFDQMRISGNKVPNNRGGSQSQKGNSAKNRNKNRNQKKSIIKKNDDASGSAKSGTNESATGETSAAPEVDNSSTNMTSNALPPGIKIKGVSFKDEPNVPTSSPRLEFGTGDSSHYQPSLNEGNEVFLNSLTGDIPHSSLVNDTATSSLHF